MLALKEYSIYILMHNGVFFSEKETDCFEHLLHVNYNWVSLKGMYHVETSADYGSEAEREHSWVHLAYILRPKSVSC